MQDFFCNKRLSGIVPQFDKRDLERGEISDYKIYTRCRGVINGFLNGVITANGIAVSDKSSATVTRIVTACKSVLEAMFNNSASLLQNIRDNRRVYTTAASVSQIAELDDPSKKLKFLNEILDNINYNPEFNSQNSVRSYSTKPYQERQKAWARRVGYKLKEAQ
ncbi:MAG: hypothetical protein NC184_05700 [Roseburia sp.]|nr:hypothetical protein [Roseburia sp.]